jgi:hypothetical protein
MRIATQFALILLASNLAAHGQHFRQVTISTGPSPRWIAVADVNHDRNPDVVVANAGSDSADSGSITVLLGDGRGGFHPAPGSPFPAGHLPNDGNLDLVVANHQSPYLRVFLGDGRGGFHLAPGSPVDVHSDPHPHGIVVADFDPDRKLDAATDSWGNNQIEILRGDGTGRLLRRANTSPQAAAPTNDSALPTSTTTAIRTSSLPISTTILYPSCLVMAVAACRAPLVHRSLQAPNPGRLPLYILPEFGEKPIGDIERHDCLLFLEKLARSFSRAVVLHCKLTPRPFSRMQSKMATSAAIPCGR